LLGIGLEGALYFCTGPNERRARNLSANCHRVLTTGQSTLDGLDLVIELTVEGVTDDIELGSVANTYESKYGPHFVAPDGTGSGLDPIRRAEVLVYRVAPETGFGFGKGGRFSQTRELLTSPCPRSGTGCNPAGMSSGLVLGVKRFARLPAIPGGVTAPIRVDRGRPSSLGAGRLTLTHSPPFVR
jgi:hypothetical protein